MTLLVSLLVAGMLLILAEAFLPGLIAGSLGVLCLLAAAGVGYTHFGSQVGSLILVGEVILGIFLTILWMKVLPSTPFGRLYILRRPDRQIPTARPPDDLVGREGVALTDLRPSGTAHLGKDRVDVVTTGEHLSAGSPIVVVRVDGPSVFVRPVQ
ncbi:MAG: hypothetical protein NTZ01_00380 [Verrucomicrobia bacterium]|nr:hypothetical protein [Verrucomicrobiota bacterium]